ncbi:MAG: FAD-dependent oxidoreductase [Cocleimonas sp.]
MKKYPPLQSPISNYEKTILINTDVLIVGGGISGLHTAYKLQKRGVSFILVEARERLGGRILSKNYDASSSKDDSIYDANKPAYDLGPSWFWPGQKNIEILVNELDLADSVFPQQGSGESVYEDQQGNIQKGFYGISMEGIYRMRGGTGQIISKLAQGVNTDNIKTSTQVTSIEYQDNKTVTSLIENQSSEKAQYQITSNKVVIALPPRIAMSSIKFKPALTESRINELNNYATWMAGHAKLLAIFDKPFWLEQGLSGDAVSQLGPIREIHDASSNPNDSLGLEGYALFGFVGVPASYRKGNEDEIKKTAAEQLVRMFGEAAANPISIVLQDWAQEVFTSTEIDLSMSGGHATSSINKTTESSFDDRLIWSGTETANHRQGTNGLLEGAVEASVRTLETLV